MLCHLRLWVPDLLAVIGYFSIYTVDGFVFGNL